MEAGPRIEVHIVGAKVSEKRLQRYIPEFEKQFKSQGLLDEAQVPKQNSSFLPDIAWLDPCGEEMTDEQWQESYAKALGVFLNGDAIPQRDSHGAPVADDSLLILFNAWDQGVEFTFPPARFGSRWELVMDTADPHVEEGSQSWKPGDMLIVGGRSVVLLVRVD